MKHINANTKSASRFVNAYNRSNETSIRECYNTFSTAKACAEIECRSMMFNEGGNGFKIISFNTFGFSCAWMVGDVLRVETPQSSYKIAL